MEVGEARVSRMMQDGMMDSGYTYLFLTSLYAGYRGKCWCQVQVEHNLPI